MNASAIEQALLPVLLPLVKNIWVSVIHPEIQKLEGTISSADLKAVAMAVDAALEPLIEAELAKLAAPAPSA